MKLRLIAISAAAVMLTGCGANRKVRVVNVPPVPIVEEEPTTSQTTTAPPVVETFPDYPVSYPEIQPQDTGSLYEAENGVFKGNLSEAYDKENYSGEGYITGFNLSGKSSVSFNIEAPSNQHYDISFNIAADRAAECEVFLNGQQLTTFRTAESGQFTEITIRGVFLVKGRSTIEVCPKGNICLDYLKLSDNSTLSGLGYDADGEPVNENAGAAAKELMSFLSENYGKYIITGQHTSGNDNSEIDLIYRTTGKYPVMRFSELSVPKGSFDESFKDVEACADWYRQGGISCVSWYWDSPSEKSSIFTEESDFVLADVMTDIDIAMLSQEEIRGLYSEGNISEGCYRLILDIDSMAGELTSLKKKGVPVLWRPLPEGSGEWYWWGASGTEAYKWLWQLLYTRLTEYFELDNLIWIWNGQSKDSLVDKSTFDIAALDIYIDGEKDYGGRFYENFAAVQKFLGSDRIIALTECGCVPDVDKAFRDNAVWSFFGLWYGEYLTDENGELSEEYNSTENLVRTYNSDGALTLDEYITMTKKEA